jgi:hypothetical protein
VNPRLRIDKVLELEGIVDGAGLAPGWPVSSVSGGNLMGSSLMIRAFLKEHDVSLPIAYACWVSMWLSSDFALADSMGDAGAVYPSIVVPGKPNMGATWLLMSAGKLSTGFDTSLS